MSVLSVSGFYGEVKFSNLNFGSDAWPSEEHEAIKKKSDFTYIVKLFIAPYLLVGFCSIFH